MGKDGRKEKNDGIIICIYSFLFLSHSNNTSGALLSSSSSTSISLHKQTTLAFHIHTQDPLSSSRRAKVLSKPDDSKSGGTAAPSEPKKATADVK